MTSMAETCEQGRGRGLRVPGRRVVDEHDRDLRVRVRVRVSATCCAVSTRKMMVLSRLGLCAEEASSTPAS